MKLIYLANARIPTEKAHGIQIMKTCEALVKAGVDVSLWVPKRKNPDYTNVNPFEFYKVSKRFPIVYLDCLDTVGRFKFLPGLGFYLQSKSFSRAVESRLKKGGYSSYIFYSRDTYPLIPILKKGLPYFYEIHTLKDRPTALTRRVISNAKGLVTITSSLSELASQYFDNTKILVAEDGVDLDFFQSNDDKKNVRLRLGLPEHEKIVLYSGHLYQWKGVETLATSSSFLGQGISIYFLGGTDQDIENFKNFVSTKKLERVKVLGRVKYGEVAAYLSAADVLVLPTSAKFEIGRSHTSPLKLFEYMASRRPIVASDVPSTREILDEQTALFFKPDDPASLAEKIKNLLGDGKLSERIAENARKKVGLYTWASRVQKIIKFLEQNI